ncbi:MAG: tetratricopeptide repeat protein [Proteobacteria bacterium]|nr:tetratricopeptide repeat protein [Pseudomonadota bacterium]
MKKGHMLKKIIGVCLFVLLLSEWSGMVLAAVDQYGYQQTNQDEERKKYIAKLLEDRQKVEMAILNTRSLIDKSRNRPYLPELYLRLAELHIEKSRIAFFVRKNQRDGESSSLDQFESNTLKNRALEIYQRILDDFPDFQDQDKVHFFMAHEFRELNKTDEMIAHYREIIRKYPNSSYVPESYLLLGDYFMGKGDVDMAKRHYEKVIDYPFSQAVVIARYKLAWCHINNADYKSAIHLFEDAVSQSENLKNIDIDTYRRVDVKQEALIDMAYCYTECYKDSTPEEALTYFQKYSWSRQVYVVVLEKLAYRYLLKKKWHHAALVYRQLSILQQDADKLLDYSKNIFECVQAMGKFDDVDQDMAIIVKALKKQKYAADVTDEVKAKNVKDYELYARDLATHLHQKARKDKSADDFRRAADAYKTYLEFFNESPVKQEMNVNYSEALFSSKDYLHAGKQYEKLALASEKDPKNRKENLYSSVISYYTAIKNKDNLDSYELAFARGGLKETGKSYAKEFPTSRYVEDVLFNVAWISYDAGNYDDAIKDFSEFVNKYPGGKPASAAVHLILDAYHLKEDHEGLIAYGRKVLADNRIRDSKLKQDVVQIVKATESKVVSNLTIAAMDDWEKGKSELLDLAEDSTTSGMGEQALNALIISAKDKDDLQALFTGGNTFIKKYPKSDKLESTMNAMIDSSLKINQYRMVASYLESFAEKFPKNKVAQDFLNQAGQIRKNLGQNELSNRNYIRILNTYSMNDGVADEVVFNMADNYIALNKDDGAISVMEGNLKKLSETGKVRAEAMIAGLYLKKGQEKNALKYRKMAYSDYSGKTAGKDPALDEAFAEMAFHAVQRNYNDYSALQLKGKIDNTVVARKAKLLEDLEKGYQSIMGYPSPVWVLSACYYAARINHEFARFLIESPLPELSADQKENYLKIIQQKADGYSKKGDQYLDTFVKQAKKLEICDSKVAGLVDLSSGKVTQKGRMQSFNGSEERVSVAQNSLKDEDTKILHEKLMKHSNDAGLLLSLSSAFINKGDYRLGLLIAQNALSGIKTGKSEVKADLYNNIGVAYLFMGQDELAKDAFKSSLENSGKNIGAQVNLAGLYSYYGHERRAYSIYDTLPGTKLIEETGQIIHPKAKELYMAQRGGKRK